MWTIYKLWVGKGTQKILRKQEKTVIGRKRDLRKGNSVGNAYLVKP